MAFDINYEPGYFELALCQQQGRLFRECQWDFEADAFDFITKYLNSGIAKEIDRPYSFYHSMGIKALGEYFLRENNNGVKKFTGDYLDSEALFWVGYMYRYWACMGQASKEIINETSAEHAFMMYPGYHTLAVPEAIRMFKKPKITSGKV